MWCKKKMRAGEDREEEHNNNKQIWKLWNGSGDVARGLCTSKPPAAKNTTCYGQLTDVRGDFFSIDRKRRVVIESFLDCIQEKTV